MEYSYSYSAYSTGISTGQVMFLIIFSLVMIVAQWVIFTKAGEAGWKSIIPFYNLYTLFKIVDGQGWKFLLLFIPLVNIIIAIILCLNVAKAFGKSSGFGIGLFFLGPIFYLILAFGSAEYQGPVNKQ